MRPLHIGLLVVGAALAGGLAVKMTEPQPIPVAAMISAPVIKTTPVPVAPSTPEVAPEVVPRPAKPSPMPDPVLAPPPAYEESATPKVPIRINKPKFVTPARTPWTPAAEAKALAVYDSPPQFVTEPAAEAAKAVPTPAPAAVAKAIPPRKVTLRTGTAIEVRIDESLSSDRNAGGDTFNASLADPLVIDGLVIAERGARVRGRVVNAQKAGHLSGTSFIELGLSGITTSDGQDIGISTDTWAQRADSSRGEDAAKVGGGAALGAIIGAVAGGGKGAAIGAGAGGVAGAGVVAATRGKPANISSETIVRFRLASAVIITERR
jgi:hypothetical protein